MPNDTDKKVAAAKAALSSAQNFTSQIVPQVAGTGVGHSTGQAFAAQHGMDHTGGTKMSMPATHSGPNEINDALRWRSQQIAQNSDVLDYNK
jgi:hypothetical protein